MEKSASIYVAGHTGLAGSAIVRQLHASGYDNLLLKTHRELDLTNLDAVKAFFEQQRPQYVIVAAAKVGGIMAHFRSPVDFISDNLEIQNNVIKSAYAAGVDRLLFLGSSCIYPRECPQPIKESYLLSGPLEPSNRAYAIAKIAGVELCWSYNRQYKTRYLAAMPTNLFGPRDNYDLNNSHVVPALIRKMHEAKVQGATEVPIWGSGTPRREFLHSDDLGSACVFLLNLPETEFIALTQTGDEPPLVNVGYGKDISIRELATTVAEVVGFKGELKFDPSKPDGTPRKLLDISRIEKLGWHPQISLREGLKSTYEVFQQEYKASAVTHANS